VNALSRTCHSTVGSDSIYSRKATPVLIREAASRRSVSSPVFSRVADVSVVSPTVSRTSPYHRRRRRCRHQHSYTYGESGVISMPVNFRRHLVGKTLINVSHYDIAEIRFVGQLVITDIFINRRLECYINNTKNLRLLTPYIVPCYTHKMAIVSWP